MRIWLVGMMGSGKSVVGKAIAQKTGASFVDLDREIEAGEGRSVRRIFRESGERRFRRLEARTVAIAARETDAVIATGGGAVLDPGNVERMRRSGTVVWLSADPAVLARRVSRQPGSRPLLEGRAPEEALRSILHDRESAYRRAAHVRVESTGRTPAAVAGAVLAAVGAVRVPVRIPGSARKHDVHVGTGISDRTGEIVRECAGEGVSALVVTDETVGRLHAARIERSLRRSGYRPHRLTIPSGERHKNLRTVTRLWEAALAHGVDRRTPVIALGGGVVGDLAGFVAATLLRGLPLVQVPTTLVAQVDSSIGGKTAFDTRQGKNLVGAFKHADAVITDVSMLRTLPPREVRAGFAEVVKYGVIADAELFALLERSGPSPFLAKDAERASAIVRRCVEIKASVVSRDPEERRLRAVLNFGHTVGHALEAASGFRSLHGEAVAAGMLSEAEFAAEQGWSPARDVLRLGALLRESGLPLSIGAPAPARFLGADKKRRGGNVLFPALRRIGRVELREVPLSALRKWLGR